MEAVVLDREELHLPQSPDHILVVDTPQTPDLLSPEMGQENHLGGLGVRMAGRALSLCGVTNLSPAHRAFSCDKSHPSVCQEVCAELQNNSG